MHIKYIWVKKYRTLENLDLNFSSDLIFTYDNSTSRLHCSDSNEVEIKNFFNNNIVALSAIVGENGIGKTSVLSLLQIVYNDLRRKYAVRRLVDEFDAPSNKKQQINYVAVFETSGQLYYVAEGVEVKKSDSRIKLASSGLKMAAETSTLIYYANFFDYSDISTGEHLLDLSTNATVSRLMRDMLDTHENQSEYFSERDFLFNYKTSEISDQFDFLLEFESAIPFPMPKGIRLSAKPLYDQGEMFPYEEFEDDPTYHDKALELLNKILDRFSYLKTGGKLRSPAMLFKRKLQRVALANYVKKVTFVETPVSGFYNYQVDLHSLIPVLEKLQDNEPDQIFTRLFDALRDLSTWSYSGKSILNWIDQLIAFIDWPTQEEDNEHINIPITQANHAEFKSLFKEYFELKFHPVFIDLFWDGISSGENAFLTMFSRFYSFRSLGEKKGSSLIFLLDECEVNFHPNWQRKLVSYLNTLLPIIFPNSSIQIILSSHSPIILSDIPKSNILFLRKFNEKVVVSHLEERRQTFAANIHTLYADAFFMNEGTLGEFARNKINDVIEKLTSRYKVVEENVKQIQDLIDLIGEPVIKSKLTQMLNEKTQLSLYDINDRVRKLENK